MLSKSEHRTLRRLAITHKRPALLKLGDPMEIREACRALGTIRGADARNLRATLEGLNAFIGEVYRVRGRRFDENHPLAYRDIHAHRVSGSRSMVQGPQVN